MAVQHPKPLNEARALIFKGDVDGAMAFLTNYLNQNFFDADAMFLLGSCFSMRGMDGISAIVMSAAIDAKAVHGEPFPEAMLNLGVAYRKQRQNETAIKIWSDTLKYESLPHERAKILSNIGSSYVNEGNPEEAIKFCCQALAEDPACPTALANFGIANLELGNWSPGWKGYYHAYETGDRHKKKYGKLPEWDGSPGRVVIVAGEQGIGDEIFYAECLDAVVECSARVIFDCHPRLERLFKESFTRWGDKLAIHGTRKNLTELPWLHGSGAEATIQLGDLPGLFRNETKDWRGEPYIDRPESNFSPGPIRIGISWVGGSSATRIEQRSINLSDMMPIFNAVPEAEWYSLQYTPDAARQVCQLEEKTGVRVRHYPGKVECFDYAVTADFVDDMDIVITVCTAVHDLASAMGVPNWVMVPSKPSWRFQLCGDRLPWYGSARLFRQVGSDWSGVIEGIAERLRDGPLGMTAELRSGRAELAKDFDDATEDFERAKS